MKLLCVGYRSWALTIYQALVEKEAYEITIIKSPQELEAFDISTYNPDFILFYGWSWIVRSSLISSYNCLMLHPSPLPKYRGGSPIQNQIINNEKSSCVSIFLMDEGIDTGPILAQEYLSLEGGIDDIFNCIIKIGCKLTVDILSNPIIPIPQDHSQATYFSRRQPKDSEITIDELTQMPANYIYNKIRMLQDPYPNAFITTVDGKKLFITSSYIGE